MGFPKGANIPFGQGRGQNPAREVASFIDPARDAAVLSSPQQSLKRPIRSPAVFGATRSQVAESEPHGIHSAEPVWCPPLVPQATL